MAIAPDCDYDETSKPGFVRVRMRIQGIKPAGSGILSSPSQAKDGNAEIKGPFHDNNQSVTLEIVNKGGLDESYTFHVQKLPDVIDPSKTKVEVKENWVYLWLKKGNKSKSWESNFRTGSLESQ